MAQLGATRRVKWSHQTQEKLTPPGFRTIFRASRHGNDARIGSDSTHATVVHSTSHWSKEGHRSANSPQMCVHCVCQRCRDVRRKMQGVCATTVQRQPALHFSSRYQNQAGGGKAGKCRGYSEEGWEVWSRRINESGEAWKRREQDSL